MARVVVTKLEGRSSGKTGAATTLTGSKRVRDQEGRTKTLRTLDADSDAFGAALTYVFGRNVAKAREENKRIVGTRDVAPAKG